MIKIHKTLTVVSAEYIEKRLAQQDAFASGGTGPGSPNIEPEIMEIWNQGKERLSYEFIEESQQEIDQKEARDTAEAEKIEAYKSDLELWKNEKVRPIRDSLMFMWVDYYASKPLLWAGLEEVMKTEISDTRQILLDWPATFTKYVTDQEIEAQKPATPSYIKE